MERVAPITAHRLPVGLTWLAGVAAFGVATSAVYATTGLGFPCPFRIATGWDCPFCGGTRMGTALLHLDLASAFWLNPLAFVALVVATVTGLWLGAELITRRRGWLAGHVRGLLARQRVSITPTTVAIATLVGLGIWTVLRNLLIGPLP